MASNDRNVREVTVTGSAVLSVTPDTVRLRVRAVRKYEEYQQASKKMGDAVSQLKDVAKDAGLGKNSFITRNMWVSACYRESKNGKGRKERVKDGFEYRLETEFVVPIDSKKLPKVMAGIDETGLDPDISMTYEHSDISAYVKLCLEEASRNARDQAETIVRAVGEKLGRLSMVEHESYRPRYHRSNDSAGLCCVYGSSASDEYEAYSDIAPEDIEIEENVTMTWEIAD